MAIDKLTQQDSFEPEAVRDMTDAYNKALRGVAEILAKKIVASAQQGVVGADALCELALLDFGLEMPNPKQLSVSPLIFRRAPALLH
jgi:hypothetical protein